MTRAELSEKSPEFVIEPNGLRSIVPNPLTFVLSRLLTLVLALLQVPLTTETPQTTLLNFRYIEH